MSNIIYFSINFISFSCRINPINVSVCILTVTFSFEITEFNKFHIEETTQTFDNYDIKKNIRDLTMT